MKIYIKLQDPELIASLCKLDSVEVRKFGGVKDKFGDFEKRLEKELSKIARQIVGYSLEVSEPDCWNFCEIRTFVSAQAQRVTIQFMSGEPKRDVVIFYGRKNIFTDSIFDKDEEEWTEEEWYSLSDEELGIAHMNKMSDFIDSALPDKDAHSCEVWAEVKGSEDEAFIKEQLLLQKLAA